VGERTNQPWAWAGSEKPAQAPLRGVRSLPEGMGEQQDGVVLVVSCACGVVMRGTESELVPMVQKHARESHNMNPTREDVLSRARPES
jgi:predicted small metal-binding protein